MNDMLAEMAYLAIIPFLFWCVNAVLGLRLGLVTCILAFIGFSRVSLGVPFMSYEVARWGVVALVAVVYVIMGDRFETWLAGQEVRVKVITAAAVAFGMNALVPQETNVSGFFFGAAAGAALLFNRMGFSVSGAPMVKAARYAVGSIVVAALYVGVKIVEPAPGFENHELIRFLRYGLIGAWVTAGAPWLFARIGLGAPS